MFEKLNSNFENIEKSFDKAAIAFLVNQKTEGERHLCEAMKNIGKTFEMVRLEFVTLNQEYGNNLRKKSKNSCAGKSKKTVTASLFDTELDDKYGTTPQ